MNTSPIGKELFDSVFQSPLIRNYAIDHDPSSDEGLILDWLSEVLDSDPKHLSDPSLRIRNCLRNVGVGNERLFEHFLQIVRSHLCKQGSQLEETIQNVEDVFSLFEWLETINTRLNYCCSIIELLPGQILLIQRAVGSIFRSVAMNHGIWNKVRVLFDYGLFTTEQQTATNPLGKVDITILENCSQLLLASDLAENLRDLILSLTRQHLREYITSKCKTIWDKPVLPALLQWMNQLLYPKIKKIFPNVDFSASYLEDMARSELLEIRIDDCFDIVIDYPDSECALQEMNECLNDEFQLSKLLQVFTQLCNKRLLHAGVNTIDIIACYKSTVKSFLIIDHRGVLLDKACRPIQKYLKEREDTVERIVFAMLDTSPENKLIEIAYELRDSYNTKPKIQDSLKDINWTPDPSDALPDFKRGIVEDVVESLISIFDSKEIFMEEFSRLFSQEFLKVTDYNIDEALFKLNLLKSRFSNCDFSALNVMLADIKHSGEVDSTIHKVNGSDALNNDKVHSSIISRLYWPEFQDTKFKIPKEIDESLQKYKELFEKNKKGRKLTLLPSMGIVSMDIELKDRTISIDVSPDKAAVLYLFQEFPEGTEIKLAMVCMKLQMPLQLVSESLAFWVKNGVLQEVSLNTYKILEESI